MDISLPFGISAVTGIAAAGFIASILETSITSMEAVVPGLITTVVMLIIMYSAFFDLISSKGDDGDDLLDSICDDDD
ncbi:hypothetical protein LMH73_012420 [Vibrio splendidus]|nr:hypothetical protein [Vibrio splendidus]MCC4880701.1 hypothetical protein [Vibrio splendidus]